MVKHFTFAYSLTPRYSSPHSTSTITWSSNSPISNFSPKTQPPLVPSPTNHWLQGLRHHRPTPASVGASHHRICLPPLIPISQRKWKSRGGLLGGELWCRWWSRKLSSMTWIAAIKGRCYGGDLKLVLFCGFWFVWNADMGWCWW